MVADLIQLLSKGGKKKESNLLLSETKKSQFRKQVYPI